MILKMMSMEQQEQVKNYTPCYIFSEQRFFEMVCKLRKCCGQATKICFSIKSNPWLIEYLECYVDQIEVCSDGELKLCEKTNIDMNCILAGGINKSYKELLHMIKAGTGMISIESEYQLKLLEQICEVEKYPCICLLRVSSGNQFGMSPEGIERILSKKREKSLISFAGLHYYSGTQKRSADDILKEMDSLEAFADKISNNFNRRPIIIEYGPGIGYPYFITDKKNFHQEILQVLSGRLRQWAEKYQLVFEAGRICASEVGDYLTRIVDIKKNGGTLYYVVDGGCHQLKYYNQSNGYRIPYFTVIHTAKRSHKKVIVTVCGSLCTAGDILIRDVELEDCDIGDIFVFHNVGAYSSMEAMALFLNREYPNIFVLEQSQKLKQLFKSRILI